MATLNMPTTPGFASSRFGLRAHTQSFTSSLNRAVQTLELPGALWFATYELPAMTRAQAAAWQALLVDLMGAAGRFWGFDPDARTPRGAYDSGSDTPLVNGASQTGASLVTDGWRVSGTGLLLPGDYVEVTAGGQKELHMVTAQVDSDGTGAATINFKPPLRASPADSAALVLANPVVEMMLADDDQAGWERDVAAIVRGVAFSAVEVF